MLTKSDLKSRLDFLRIDETIRKDLRNFAAIAETVLPDVLERFYAHIDRHPEIARFFSDSKQKEFAASRQFQHWKVILSGEFGDDYINSVAKIGATHARIGLEPQYYLGGYAFLVEEMLSDVQKHYSHKRELKKD